MFFVITKSQQCSGLRLLSGNPEVMCSNLTRNNRIFCYFSLYALPFKLLFPYLPKGIFPFPFKHRQPQLSSHGKCKEKPGIMKSGLDAKPLFLQDRLLSAYFQLRAKSHQSLEITQSIDSISSSVCLSIRPLLYVIA